MTGIQTNKSDQIILNGDFNFNFLDENENPGIKSVTSHLFSSGFLPLITLPTRITDASATLIDIIASNKPHPLSKSNIITLSHSDHLATYHSFPVNKNPKAPRKITYRVYNQEAKEKFCGLMSSHNFDNIANDNNVESAFNDFFSVQNKYFNIAFPPKTKFCLKKYDPINQWMSKGLLISKSNKDKLFLKMLKLPSHTNKEKYRDFNSMYKKLCRAAKGNFFKEKFESSENDIKLTWQHIRTALNTTKTKSGHLSFILSRGIKISNKKEMADCFNEFFSTIGPQLAAKIPPSQTSFSSFLGPPTTSTFRFKTLTAHDILDTLKK